MAVHDWGQNQMDKSAQRKRVLVQVMNIIEDTYPHDDGKRIDGDSPVSGADVVEMLVELEDDITQAIED